jgi:hypothetical protein
VVAVAAAAAVVVAVVAAAAAVVVVLVVSVVVGWRHACNVQVCEDCRWSSRARTFSQTQPAGQRRSSEAGQWQIQPATFSQPQPTSQLQARTLAKAETTHNLARTWSKFTACPTTPPWRPLVLIAGHKCCQWSPSLLILLSATVASWAPLLLMLANSVACTGHVATVQMLSAGLFLHAQKLTAAQTLSLFANVDISNCHTRTDAKCHQQPPSVLARVGE